MPSTYRIERDRGAKESRQHGEAEARPRAANRNAARDAGGAIARPGACLAIAPQRVAAFGRAFCRPYSL
jgi:hypothetical protein